MQENHRRRVTPQTPATPGRPKASGRRGSRQRLDLLMVARGLARSRDRAQALVLSGVVRVDGRPAGKAGSTVPAEATLTVIEPDHPYVGRGGVKLQSALERFGLDPSARIALDIGASTGGFTDCLLQRGARKVYALDVGAGQLDWSLRRDARVVVLERRNARHLKPADLPERAGIAVVDVSFISLRLILPVLPALLEDDAAIVALVKPQFEVGRREVGPGGIVRDPRLHLKALNLVADAAVATGLAVRAACPSPITGMEGNREFFIHFAPGGAGLGAPERARLFGGLVDAGGRTPRAD